MNTSTLNRWVGSVLLPALLSSGCSIYHYEPKILAPGEMTVRSSWQGVEFHAGGQRRARSIGLYSGLEEYVGCVPQAATYARRAENTSIATALLGGGALLFGLLGFGYLIRDAITPDSYSFSDCVPDETGQMRCLVLGRGQPLSGRAFGLSLTGTLMAGAAIALRYRATGQALDAMNYYNDSVGSLGATCADLKYAEPSLGLPNKSPWGAVPKPDLPTGPAAKTGIPPLREAVPSAPSPAKPPARRGPAIYINKISP